MPTVTFAVQQLARIDGIHPTVADPDSFDVGVTYLGAKSGRFYTLLDFDVFGTPASGARPLNAADEIQSAALVEHIIGALGIAGWTATARRFTRPTWIEAEATWNKYNAANNWTTAGGDVATPPAAVQYVAQFANGPHDIDVTEFVQDAIDNRAGRVLVRLQKDDESVTRDELYSAVSTPDGNPARPYLRVDYATADPSPIDHPQGGKLAGSSAQLGAAARPASPGRGAAAARGATPAPPK